jgi:hypothetical protein
MPRYEGELPYAHVEHHGQHQRRREVLRRQEPRDHPLQQEQRDPTSQEQVRHCAWLGAPPRTRVGEVPRCGSPADSRVDRRRQHQHLGGREKFTAGARSRPPGRAKLPPRHRRHAAPPAAPREAAPEARGHHRVAYAHVVGALEVLHPRGVEVALARCRERCPARPSARPSRRPRCASRRRAARRRSRRRCATPGPRAPRR